MKRGRHPYEENSRSERRGSPSYDDYSKDDKQSYRSAKKYSESSSSSSHNYGRRPTAPYHSQPYQKPSIQRLKIDERVIPLNLFDDDEDEYFFHFHYPFPQYNTTNSTSINNSIEKMHQENPHLKQCPHPIIYDGEFTFEKNLILQDDAKSAPYRSRKGEIKSVNHWGQRKLLLSEIQLLTLVMEQHSSHKQYTVVYAGAAPGTHIDYLSELFPNCKFVLVDPNDFTVKQNEKITVKQEYFTDEIAKQFANRDDIVFVSDIRTADWKRMDEKENEEHVKKDQEMQLRWHQIMKPVKAMFKFRLPYFEGKSTYLAGKILLPIWGPQTTTETRLVADDWFTMKEYDHAKYEQQLFYFNTITRVHYYPHSVKAEGLDHCFDCKAEVEVLKKYLQVMHPREFHSETKQEEFDEKIATMVEEISKRIAHGRTLAHEYVKQLDRGRVPFANVTKHFSRDRKDLINFK